MMNIYTRFAWLVLLGGLAAACNKQPATETERVDPKSIVKPPPGVPDDKDTDLHVVRSLSGLVGRDLIKGQWIDELMVMVYGHGSREAIIRRENIEKGRSSLERWLKQGKGNQTIQNGRYLRVPDLDDEGGSRFYYFERATATGEWEFRAICSGARGVAWGKQRNPNRLVGCDLTYTLNKKILMIAVEEPIFQSEHYDELRSRIVAALTKDGVGN